MRELKLSRNAWDYERMFKVEGVSGDIKLFKDKIKEGDGLLYGLQSGTMIKSYYSPEEIAHSERMKKEAPLKQGEIVLIEGKQYKAKIIGNYSTCVDFIEVEGEE